MTDNEPEIKPATPRRGDAVTDRRFKRYHRVRARQQANAKADDAFFKAVFSLAGIATVFVFILIYAAVSGGGALAQLAPLSEPWLGPFSVSSSIHVWPMPIVARSNCWPKVS